MTASLGAPPQTGTLSDLNPDAPPFVPPWGYDAGAKTAANTAADTAANSDVASLNPAAKEFVPTHAIGSCGASKTGSNFDIAMNSKVTGRPACPKRTELANLLRRVRFQELCSARRIQRCWRAALIARCEERAVDSGLPQAGQEPQQPPACEASNGTPAWSLLGNCNGPMLTYEEMLERRHEGVVVEYIEHRGFGFLRHPGIFFLIGKDVFFRGSDFPSARCTGSRVEFRVAHDRDGRLLARDPAQLELEESRSGWQSDSPLTWEELLCADHAGTIREWHEERGFGFVKNLRIHNLCGHDVFFLRGQLGTDKEVVGAAVNFHVELDDAQRPRVKGASTAGPTPGVSRGGSSQPEEVSPMSLEECLSHVHEGVICDFDPARGRGFVRNSRIHRLLGKDLLFHRGQFETTAVGDAVCFRVELDLDGRPRVRQAAEPETQSRTQSSNCGVNGAMIQEVLEQRQNGYISSYNAATGIGLIRSRNVLQACGCDAVITTASFAGFKVGDAVEFRVDLQTDGAPRAHDINLVGGDSLSTLDEHLTIEDLLAREHTGVIAEFDEAHGHGFIRCAQVQRLCGKDVFFRRGEFPGCLIGDPVAFRVALDAVGRPRTREAQQYTDNAAAGLATNCEAGMEHAIDELVKGEHTGVIKEYFVDKGFGFVTSDAVLRLLGKDLFFRRGDFDACAPGSTVQFRVELDREGRPKARDPKRFAAAKSMEASLHGRTASLSTAESEGEELTEEEMLTQEHLGTIAEYSHARGYGFIRHASIKRLTGHHVLIHKGQFWGHDVGGAVAFHVKLNRDGCTRAMDVRPAQQSPAIDSGSTAPHVWKMLAIDPLTAAVIGRGGTGIAEFWRSTQTRVHVTPRGDCYPGTNFRVLTMMSETHDMLISALSQVLMLLANCNEASPPRDGRPVDTTAPGANLCDHLAFRVLVPSEFVRDGAGLNVEASDSSAMHPGIRALQEQSGCAVALEREGMGSTEAEEAVLLLSGSLTTLKSASSALVQQVNALRLEHWFREWVGHTNTASDVLVSWQLQRTDGGSDAAQVLSWEDLTSHEHIGVIGSGSSFHAFIENVQIRRLTGCNVFVPKSQLWGRKHGDGVKFRVQLDPNGRPRAVSVRALVHDAADESEHSGSSWCDVHDETNCKEEKDNTSSSQLAPGEVKVVLGQDFGPLGLRFRAGHLPEIEAIRPELQPFWECQHGVRVNDKLASVNGRSVEGCKCADALQELKQRPIQLIFERASAAVDVDVGLNQTVVEQTALDDDGRDTNPSTETSAQDPGPWQGTSWKSWDGKASWYSSGQWQKTCWSDNPQQGIADGAEESRWHSARWPNSGADGRETSDTGWHAAYWQKPSVKEDHASSAEQDRSWWNRWRNVDYENDDDVEAKRREENLRYWNGKWSDTYWEKHPAEELTIAQRSPIEEECNINTGGDSVSSEIRDGYAAVTDCDSFLQRTSSMNPADCLATPSYNDPSIEESFSCEGSGLDPTGREADWTGHDSSWINPPKASAEAAPSNSHLPSWSWVGEAAPEALSGGLAPVCAAAPNVHVPEEAGQNEREEWQD